MLRAAAVAVLAVWALSSHPAAAGQLVVIDSTSPQIKAGQMMQAGQRLSLVGGARITLIAEDGSVTRIEGPFNGALPGDAVGEAGGTAMVQAISKLVSGTAPETTGLATFRAVRSGATAFGSPDLGAIDIRGAATQCVPAGIAPTLWRAAVDGDLTVVVEPETGSPAVVRFAAGRDRVAWPATVRVQDMSFFTLREAGGRWVSSLKVRTIPDGVTGTVQRIAWMSENGCDDQALAMLAALR